MNILQDAGTGAVLLARSLDRRCAAAPPWQPAWYSMTRMVIGGGRGGGRALSRCRPPGYLKVVISVWVFA
jgi:hypothetical protein